MPAEPGSFRTRDGEALVIRPIAASDRDGLARHFQHLSAESRYRRFLNPKTRLTADELTRLTALDHHDREALVALESGGDLVAVARYFVLPERPEAAEVAIAVADDWQHRGVGTAMLAQLMARAAADGITTFVASCLADNREMITLFRELGERVTCTGQGAGVIELEISLPAPTSSGTT